MSKRKHRHALRELETVLADARGITDVVECRRAVVGVVATGLYEAARQGHVVDRQVALLRLALKRWQRVRDRA